MINRPDVHASDTTNDKRRFCIFVLLSLRFLSLLSPGSWLPLLYLFMFFFLCAFNSLFQQVLSPKKKPIKFKALETDKTH